jgi:surface polysaccharide O-acyltransferase-like enzyme
MASIALSRVHHKKNYIDYLRVLAITAVITIHVTASFYGRVQIRHFGWWLSDLFNAASRFSVPLFVMISGAVLLGREIGAYDFYKRRSSRLLPPIAFWTVFYIVFKLLCHEMTVNELFHYFEIVFATGEAYYHLWFFSMFACLMIFAPFINLFISGQRPSFDDLSILLVVIFIFLVLNEFSSVLSEVRNVKIEWFKVFPWYLGYFIGGYYIDVYGDEINISNGIMLLTIFTVTVAGAVLNFYAYSSLGIKRDYLILSNDGPFVFIDTVFIFLFVKKNKMFSNEYEIISQISEASFGIFLIHPVFIYILEHHLPYYFTFPSIYMPLSIIVTMLCSFYSIT